VPSDLGALLRRLMYTIGFTSGISKVFGRTKYTASLVTGGIPEQY
jgi:hypothetical protein